MLPASVVVVAFLSAIAAVLYAANKEGGDA